MDSKSKTDHKRRRISDVESRNKVTKKSLKKTGEEATSQTTRINKKDHFFATKENINDSTDEEDYNDEENPPRDCDVRNESFSTTALSSQFDQLKEKVAEQELAIQRLLSLVDGFQSQRAEDRNEIVTLKDTSFVQGARIQQLQTELDEVKQDRNMEKIGKGLPTMDSREFDLPEPLIRLIQSFLTTKEATQTTLLSRSWLSAWLTRPNLVFNTFDLFDFSPTPDLDCQNDILLDYAEKTIRRYEMSNLNIQSFSINDFRSNSDSFNDRLTNLILGALKVGAAHLSLCPVSCFYKCPNEVSLCPVSCFYKCPNGVFVSENLVSLELQEVGIDLGPNSTVAFPMLRSLSLENLKIQSYDMLLQIISSCPLIEKLALRTIWWPGDDDDDGFGDNCRLIELRRLSSLVLDETDLFTEFLDGLSANFPSLKDLTLCMFIGEAEEEMLISSPSLERLVLNIARDVGGHSNTIQSVKLDLPSICKLTFEGSGNDNYWDNRPGSMVWESDDDVSIKHHHKCLTANTMDFLGVTLLQVLNVRISNLRQLMYGLNDLKEARAQILDKDASMWRDVPLLDDTAIPEDNQDAGFQLIWQPKLKKLN